MEKEAEKFLEAQETATKLISTLTQLYNEATSYKAAKEELESVRLQLVGLIDTTKQVVVGSHEIVGTLKEIGASDILNRLAKLRFLVLVTLGSSIIALIVGIVAVLG